MAAQEFSPAAVREFSAAVKEVMTNIIRHGYRGKPGEIRVSCTGSPEKVAVEIADSAPAFDPTKFPGADRGPGIAFVRQAADIVTYRHRDHRNFLTLVKVRRKGEC
jgi:anti-sigma regulatory factor (Ser/Thr protein kinase)